MRPTHLRLRFPLRSAHAALVLFLLASSLTSAQTTPVVYPQHLLGVSLALTHNNHAGNGATGFGSDCWEDAPGGRALGFAAGATMLLRQTPDLSYVARVSYENRPGMVVSVETDARRVSYRQTSRDSVQVLVSEDSTIIRNELQCELVTADVQIDLRLLQASRSVSIHASGGLSLGYVLRGTATRARELHASIEEGALPVGEGEVAENGGRRIVYERDREVDGLRDLRMSLKTGLGFQIEASRSVFVRTGVQYDFGITPLSSEREWRLGSTFIGVDVLVRL